MTPRPRIAIIGMGMMGGSLGLAARQRKPPCHVTGIGRNPLKLALAKKIRACDRVTTSLQEGVHDADIVFICTALSVILPTLKQIAPHLKPGALVTDIGSVKSFIAREAGEIMNQTSKNRKGCFIGGHPLTGSEKTGVENSVPRLYRNATVVLTPPAGYAVPLRKLFLFWKSLGARPVSMDPEIHDLLVAQTSHLPHVLSGALSQMIASLQKRDPNTHKLLAGSFKDMTRISDADPVQWSEISNANNKYLAGALKSYLDILNQLLKRLEKSADPAVEWKNYFDSARLSRAMLMNPSRK